MSPLQSSEITITIQPRPGWAALQLGEVWEYRDLLYFMVWRDIKARYRQTALGPVWIVLQPLVSMVLYTVIFGLIAKLPSDGLPYTVFSYVGLLPWNFFSATVTNAMSSLGGSKDLIAKVYFPRLLVPLSRMIGDLVDLSLSFGILILMLLYYQISPTWGIVLIPLFLAIAAMTGLGFGMLFSGLVVKYRDVVNIVGYIMRVWMYATPVVYSNSLVPETLQPLYDLNPMTTVVDGFRWALVGSTPPAPESVALSTGVALLLFVAGLFAFKRVERNIVDVV